MSLNIRIECLPEPKLLFGANETGVEPRRVMAKHGAADKSAPKELRIGIVGPDGGGADCPRLAAPAQPDGHCAGKERSPLSQLAGSATGARGDICHRRPIRAASRRGTAESGAAPFFSVGKVRRAAGIIRCENSGILRRRASGLHHRLPSRRTCGHAHQQSKAFCAGSAKPWSGCSGKRNRSRCLSFSRRRRN